MQICMSLEKLLMDRLKQYKEDRKLTQLSKAVGISQPTLSRAANNGTGLDIPRISKLVDFFGLSVRESGIDHDQYEMVPKVSAKAGAGSSLITEGDTEGFYAFRTQFLLRSGIHAKQSFMLDVMGDSMEPLIMNGDTILVDSKERSAADGKIYLVALDGDLMVKRVQRAAGGCLLVSQNKAYEPIPVSGEQTDFVVHGRVRWFGRLLA